MQHPPGPVPSSWGSQSRPVPAQETGVRLAACRPKRPRTMPQGRLTRVPIAAGLDSCLQLPAECRPVDFLGRAVSSFPDLVSCLKRDPDQQFDEVEDQERYHDHGCGGRDDRQGEGSYQGDTPGFCPPLLAPCGIRQGTQPYGGPHDPAAQERDAEFPHGLPEDAVCVDPADAVGWDSDVAQVVVQDGGFGVAAVARDEPHEHTRYRSEIGPLACRHLEVLARRTVAQRPQGLPVLVIDLADIDGGAGRESERPLGACVSALQRYLNSHDSLLPRRSIHHRDANPGLEYTAVSGAIPREPRATRRGARDDRLVQHGVTSAWLRGQVVPCFLPCGNELAGWAPLRTPNALIQ